MGLIEYARIREKSLLQYIPMEPAMGRNWAISHCLGISIDWPVMNELALAEFLFLQYRPSESRLGKIEFSDRTPSKQTSEETTESSDTFDTVVLISPWVILLLHTICRQYKACQCHETFVNV